MVAVVVRSPPLTARSPVRVESPVTPRVEERVVAPVTPRVPETEVLPLVESTVNRLVVPSFTMNDWPVPPATVRL